MMNVSEMVLNISCMECSNLSRWDFFYRTSSGKTKHKSIKGLVLSLAASLLWNEECLNAVTVLS